MPTLYKLESLFDACIPEIRAVRFWILEVYIEAPAVDLLVELQLTMQRSGERSCYELGCSTRHQVSSHS